MFKTLCSFVPSIKHTSAMRKLWCPAEARYMFHTASPDVIVINDLLSELNCDDNAVDLKESDCVCNACYRAHLAMLKTTEKGMCKSDNDTQL